jgi:hypothetical protein
MGCSTGAWARRCGQTGCVARSLRAGGSAASPVGAGGLEGVAAAGGTAEASVVSSSRGSGQERSREPSGEAFHALSAGHGVGQRGPVPALELGGKREVAGNEGRVRGARRAHRRQARAPARPREARAEAAITRGMWFVKAPCMSHPKRSRAGLSVDASLAALAGGAAAARGPSRGARERTCSPSSRGCPRSTARAPGIWCTMWPCGRSTCASFKGSYSVGGLSSLGRSESCVLRSVVEVSLRAHEALALRGDESAPATIERLEKAGAAALSWSAAQHLLHQHTRDTLGPAPRGPPHLHHGDRPLRSRGRRRVDGKAAAGGDERAARQLRARGRGRVGTHGGGPRPGRGERRAKTVSF